MEPRDGLMEESLPFDRVENVLYPVSVWWQPAFTVMVDLIGHGELQVLPPPLADACAIACLCTAIAGISTLAAPDA